MRFIIYGAGGIGCVIGARLLEHGQDVVLIARGAHLEAMQKRGLSFLSPRGSVTLPVHAVGHPAELELGPSDVVLLTMKSQHTQAALEDLRAAAGDDVPVICAQNGVANERMALRLFRRVYGMVVIVPASHLEPGVVQTEATGCTGILDAGAYPAGTDKLIEEVTATLDRSGFSARPESAIMRWKYAKLLMNVNNSLQAVCRLGPEAREVARRVRREALRCYEAAAIDCASAEEVRARRADLMQLAPVAGQPRSGGSSWQSLERGTGDIEADQLNGEIVLLGRLHGIPTPANCVLQRLANEFARTRARPGTLSLEEVCALIEREAGEQGLV